MAWGHVTVEILNLSLVGKAKTLLLHFTLKLEGLRDQGSLNGRTTYMSEAYFKEVV